MWRCVLALALFCAGCSGPVQSNVDAGIANEIAHIRAIDHHAHPARATGPGETDAEYDALPVENLEPWSDPVRLRPDAAWPKEAWRDLYGYRSGSPSHRKDEALRKYGQEYPAWVLDRLGIDVMMANRVAMGRSLESPRFRWVAFADALMLPLDTSRAADTPDRKAMFALEKKLLDRYVRESGQTGLPAGLDGYLKKVVTPTLERHKAGGALAEKFEAAYLRALDFAPPDRAEAERIYHRGGARSAVEYKPLEDYLFHYIASECGRLGMAVHFHTGAGGGSYFETAGSNPALLEPVLTDQLLRKTNFAMLHGGWPYNVEAAAQLVRPNVYLDFSAQGLMQEAPALAAQLRVWLEFVPQKVMFGTDAYPYSPDMGWEETAWIANKTGREALGIALTGMLRDGAISRERALELARMVLRENARKLYGL